MVSYKNYTAEDLLQDDMFRRWVLSPGEETGQLWEGFLLNYPEKQSDVTRARAMLLAMHGLEQDPDAEKGRQMWSGILERIDDDQQAERPLSRSLFVDFRRYWGYAAAVIVLGFCIWWLASIREIGRVPRTYAKQVARETDQLIEYFNQTGRAARLVLPDGSVVVLGKGAKVSYEKGFAGNERKVYLSGQGYFEVVKDPGKPFFVFADNIVTQVVGTRFTVNNPAQTADISVAVKSGKVKVFTIENYQNSKADQGQKALLLTANEQATFRIDKGVLTKGIAAKPEVIKAPEKFPNFNFEKTSIEDVFMTLGDSYGVLIEYDPKMIANCNLTAELGNEPLFKKMDIICRTIDATYEVWGTKIVVTAKGCSPY